MKAPNFCIASALCILLLCACGTPSPFPLSFPSSKTADDRIIGKWRMAEDTNTNNFYEITKRDFDDDFQYHVRFFDRGGTNPTYESNIFFSEINDVKFLNVPYFQEVSQGKAETRDWDNIGYFFIRIMEADKDFNKVTTATLNTPDLETIRSATQLEIYMHKNLDNPSIYSDTVHFYKVRIPQR